MYKLYKTIQTELEKPLEGTVKGTIPRWLNGSLYRNGPGMFEVGEHKFNHWFDGMSMLQRFQIFDGKVTYQRKYLRSDEFVTNMTSGRIVYDVYATDATPDPCKNIFKRFLTVFEAHDVTDNTHLNIYSFQGELFAAADSMYMNRVDAQTLEKIEKINLEKRIGVKLTTAHPHFDADGTMYNIGHMHKYRLYTVLFKVSPNIDQDDGFPKGNMIFRTPSPWNIHITYHHSFCMTENYLIFIEQPMLTNVLTLLMRHNLKYSHSPASSFYPNIKNRFRVVNKRSGKEENENIVVESDAFFFFHQINAYEDQGHIIVDLSCHKSYSELIGRFYLKNLASKQFEENLRQVHEPEAMRFVFPVDLHEKTDTSGDTVTLEYVNAKCTRIGKKRFHCEPEALSDIGIEFPQINYGRYNGRKYRYTYCVGMQHSESTIHSLVKLDVHTKTFVQWKEEGCYPSEPVFVPSPDGLTEDDGILVSAVNCVVKEDDTNSCFLLMLDAKTFAKLAVVEFEGIDRFPKDLHGTFTSVM